MVTRKVIALSMFLIASFLGILALRFNLQVSDEDGTFGSDDLSYKRLSPTQDIEKRQERLDHDTSGDACDLTSLAGMPEGYGHALLKYTEGTLAAIGAMPLMRRHFYHVKDINAPGEGRLTPRNYPLDVNPVYDRDITIPVVILPRPSAVSTWSKSSDAQASGWISGDRAFESSRSIYGRTLIFTPGTRSESPVTTPATPFGTGVSPGLFVYAGVFMQLGKVVASPDYDPYQSGKLVDITAPLQCDKSKGAQVLGEFLTTVAYPENTRLRWVSIRKGQEARHFLAYALVDGNGAIRMPNPNSLTPLRISAFVRPLICSQHQPKLQQHDELLLPTPLGWPLTSNAADQSICEKTPREEWCLDDWFPAQPDACWVIREAEDSKPLQESFLLMPARESSDRPVFFTALFAETEPKQLIQELAALYKVSPDKALNSPETMQRLQSLYEKVRDYPLSK